MSLAVHWHIIAAPASKTFDVFFFSCYSFSFFFQYEIIYIYFCLILRGILVRIDDIFGFFYFHVTFFSYILIICLLYMDKYLINITVLKLFYLNRYFSFGYYYFRWCSSLGYQSFREWQNSRKKVKKFICTYNIFSKLKELYARIGPKSWQFYEIKKKKLINFEAPNEQMMLKLTKRNKKDCVHTQSMLSELKGL